MWGIGGERKIGERVGGADPGGPEEAVPLDNGGGGSVHVELGGVGREAGRERLLFGGGKGGPCSGHEQGRCGGGEGGTRGGRGGWFGGERCGEEGGEGEARQGRFHDWWCVIGWAGGERSAGWAALWVDRAGGGPKDVRRLEGQGGRLQRGRCRVRGAARRV